MLIKPAMMQATVQRTQDMTSIKQNEDNRAYAAQANAQSTVKKEAEHKLKDVRAKDNADYDKHKYDAKEKGKNEYFSQKQKKDNEASQGQEDGKVIIKRRTGFDMKV